MGATKRGQVTNGTEGRKRSLARRRASLFWALAICGACSSQAEDDDGIPTGGAAAPSSGGDSDGPAGGNDDSSSGASTAAGAPTGRGPSENGGNLAAGGAPANGGGLGGDSAEAGQAGAPEASCATRPCRGLSCEGLEAHCGLSKDDDCCAAPTVMGGTFTLGTIPPPGSAVFPGVYAPASIATFALDKYEVTVGRFRKFVEAYSGHPAKGAGAHPLVARSGWQSPQWDELIAKDRASLLTERAPNESSSPSTWDPSGATDFLPMNRVTWFEAFAFCYWDGGRLPTEAEWEYTAEGGNEARMYPWGNAPVPTGKQDSTAAYANYNCLGDGSASTSCSFSDLLPVGSKPAGVGKYGQLDLAGSVYEWTLDEFEAYPSYCDNCATVTYPGVSGRVDRGGAWNTAAASLLSAARYVDGGGIRCARVAE